MAVVRISTARSRDDKPSAPESHDLRYDGFSEGRYEVLARLTAQIPRGSRVLDVGCGSGLLTQQIRDRCGAHVVGVEPNPARAEKARERGLDVRTGLFDVDFARKNGPFDVIVLADVIEHIAEPAELLKSLQLALAPGGRIIASVPNVAHWTVRLNLLRGRFDYQAVGLMDETHLRWYTRRSLVRLFEACGYEVAQVKYTSGAWMPCYRRRPAGILAENTRGALIARLANAFPGFWACQFIVNAVPASASLGAEH